MDIYGHDIGYNPDEVIAEGTGVTGTAETYSSTTIPTDFTLYDRGVDNYTRYTFVRLFENQYCDDATAAQDNGSDMAEATDSTYIRTGNPNGVIGEYHQDKDYFGGYGPAQDHKILRVPDTYFRRKICEAVATGGDGQNHIFELYVKGWSHMGNPGQCYGPLTYTINLATALDPTNPADCP